MLILAAAFIRLGLWQYHKAEAKQALQDQLEQHRHQPPVALPMHISEPEAWRYRRVSVVGKYDKDHQILLDNQVNQGIAGYHVITPLKIADTDQAVLINRGWVAAPADRSNIPDIEVPSGTQTLQGDVWFPGKYFTLEQPSTGHTAWQTVWQNLDIERYRQSAPYQIMNLVLRLAPDGKTDQLIRDWPAPADRIEKNLGYAYQWFGFAVTAFLIYLVASIKRIAPR